MKFIVTYNKSCEQGGKDIKPVDSSIRDFRVAKNKPSQNVVPSIFPQQFYWIAEPAEQEGHLPLRFDR